MNRPNDFARTCTHLMHANERARNALDGLTAENWSNLEMGYAISERLSPSWNSPWQSTK